MNTNAREKILKSWGGISEIALIKEVATKGEHIELCIEYGARKRKQTIEEYQLFFFDVVQNYVNRLLTEGLLFKADNVLRNVRRNSKYVYFHFAFDCRDDNLRESIFDYLKKKYSQKFDEFYIELQFYWQLIDESRKFPDIFANYEKRLRRLNLETLMTCGVEIRNKLIIELYFKNENSDLLLHIDKYEMWNYLVENVEIVQLIKWCKYAETHNEFKDSEINALINKYKLWHLEKDMYTSAIKNLNITADVLQNYFAKAGFFCNKELNDIPTLLRRICITQSTKLNKDFIEKLPIAKYLYKNDLHPFMLQNFTNVREIEELGDEFTENSKLMSLICELKSNSINEQEGFEKIFRVVKSYLNIEGENILNETLFELMCSKPALSTFIYTINSSTSLKISFLKSVVQRIDYSNDNNSNLPIPYALLQKLKNFSFQRLIINDDINDAELQPISFSNISICQKYAPKNQCNYLYYLKQQRGSYAAYYVLMEHLQNYGQLTRSVFFSACKTVSEWALQTVNDNDFLGHCVAFIEVLGFDSQYLRQLIKLNKLRITNSERLSHFQDYEKLIIELDNLFMLNLQSANIKFPLNDYQAIIQIVSCHQYSEWPLETLKFYAKSNDWWHLLIICQYFDMPLNEMKKLRLHFKNLTLGEHLLRALCYDTQISDYSKRQLNMWRQCKNNRRMNKFTLTSLETMASSVSSNGNDVNTNKMKQQNKKTESSPSTANVDIFALILISTNVYPTEPINEWSKFLSIVQDNQIYSTFCNLLKNSVEFHLPILSLLSTTTLDCVNIDWSWIIWLTVTTEQWTELLQLTVKPIYELTWQLIENNVRFGNTTTLYRSFIIFYNENPIQHLFKFLYHTQDNKFDDGEVYELRLYLLAWSNDEVTLPCFPNITRMELMSCTIKLLLIHLQENFHSKQQQEKFLHAICNSDMTDISGMFDFVLLSKVFNILKDVDRKNMNLILNFEQIAENDKKEYEKILAVLIAAKEFTIAIRLSTLLELPICDIIFMKWITKLNQQALDNITLQEYEEEIAFYSLPPEVLVNFFLFAAGRESNTCALKYNLLLRALNVIKVNHLFPNESFDRDQIEYEMLVCYIQIDDNKIVKNLEIYHSEYYEQIMLKERCVLFKSFMELKELAGIDDLNVSLKCILTKDMQQRLEELINGLLNGGDIVEALRVQELFEYRPIDLRFVVFCMALAEGVTTITSLSQEERLLLRDVEISAYSRYSRRTLCSIRESKTYTSPMKINADLSDSCSTLEFEEIPSKEKRETLDTIQGIASKLKHGINIAKRIVMVYRAAMNLDKEYLDVLHTKDINLLLKSVNDECCFHKLMVVSDIFASTNRTEDEIAEILSEEIATAIIRPRFFILKPEQQNETMMRKVNLWGYDIDGDYHLFLELTPNSILLGNYLLEFCDTLRIYRKFQDNEPYKSTRFFEKLVEIIEMYGMPPPTPDSFRQSTSTMHISASPRLQVLSRKKQNTIYVELLIKAYQCFVHECSMEGIANVLNRAKNLNVILTHAKSWSLIARLLTGIGRYREMYYCFDSLFDNDQFETLLGHFYEEKTISLRQAILSYIREYRPGNSPDYIKLTALHFLIYKDLAEMCERDAEEGKQLLLSKNLFNTATSNIPYTLNGKNSISKLKYSEELSQQLQQILENYTNSTEYYLLDNKLLLAQKSASKAELIAMQIDLVTKAMERRESNQLCACVLDVKTRDEFRELINVELSIPQAIILSHAYDYDMNWAEALLSQYIIKENKKYLQDYLANMILSDTIIENIVKGFEDYAPNNEVTMKMREHLVYLMELVQSITLKYKLVSLLSIKSKVLSLINDETIHYLKDTQYGLLENRNITDI